MILYYSSASPYARYVRASLISLNLADRVELCSLHPFDNPEALMSNNPLGKVPCLVNDEQQALYDSEVIVNYLDAEFGDNALSRAMFNNWPLQVSFSLTKGLLDTLVARQQEKMREKEQLGSAFWMQRFDNAIARSLSQLNQDVAMLPEQLTKLHLLIVCACDYLNFRHPDVEWQSKYPSLVDFYRTWAELPALANTRPS